MTQAHYATTTTTPPAATQCHATLDIGIEFNLRCGYDNHHKASTHITVDGRTWK